METKAQVKDYIGSGRLDKAIELLKKHFKADATIYDQVVQYENQLKLIEQNHSANAISFDEYSRQLARIQKGLLDISNDIKSFITVSPLKKIILPVSLSLVALTTVFYANNLNQAPPKSALPPLSIEKKQAMNNDIKKVRAQMNAIFTLIEANQTKVYKPTADSTYEKNCQQLIQTLDDLHSELPYQHKRIAENIISLKENVESLDSTYKKGFYDQEDWVAFRDGLKGDLRALNNLIDKLN